MCSKLGTTLYRVGREVAGVGGSGFRASVPRASPDLEQVTQIPSCSPTGSPSHPSPSSSLHLPPPWKRTCWNPSPGWGPAFTLLAAGTPGCGVQCWPAS